MANMEVEAALKAKNESKGEIELIILCLLVS